MIKVRTFEWNPTLPRQQTPIRPPKHDRYSYPNQ